MYAPATRVPLTHSASEARRGGEEKLEILVEESNAATHEKVLAPFRIDEVVPPGRNEDMLQQRPAGCEFQVGAVSLVPVEVERFERKPKPVGPEIHIRSDSAGSRSDTASSMTCAPWE